MKVSIPLTQSTLQDAINLTTGLFAPLRGFMNAAECAAVERTMRLPSGAPWPIPVTLEVNEALYQRAAGANSAVLSFEGEAVGWMRVEDCFELNPTPFCRAIFGTADLAHPGVAREVARGNLRLGGPVTITAPRLLDAALRPDRLRQLFRKNGWQTVAGFQTRNPIHRAHEYLQRIGLELCDGLFINPLFGWRRPGEFGEHAVLASYQVMADQFYPTHRVHIEGLRTSMRYAGPREAIFHALLRRNAGCSHFIIGRDHAGVGAYYPKYAAHDLARQFAQGQELGIALLLLHEPYYCRECGQIVTEQTCGHPEAALPISGTQIRDVLRRGALPDERLMRPEVAAALQALGPSMFAGKEETREASHCHCGAVVAA